MSEENEQQALPEQIIEAPVYDPENPDHTRRWELAGRPALDVVDSDGNFWRPTITKVLQGDGSYLAIPAPEPNPVTASEMAIAQTAAALAARRQTREGALFNEKDGLVATIYYYLKNPCEDAEGSAQQMSAGQALVAGQGIGDTTESGGYGPEMRGWIDLGSSAFRGKIAGDTARPWFDWKPKVEGAPDKTVRQIMLDRIDAATNPS